MRGERRATRGLWRPTRPRRGRVRPPERPTRPRRGRVRPRKAEKWPVRAILRPKTTPEGGFGGKTEAQEGGMQPPPTTTRAARRGRGCTAERSEAVRCLRAVGSGGWRRKGGKVRRLLGGSGGQGGKGRRIQRLFGSSQSQPQRELAPERERTCARRPAGDRQRYLTLYGLTKVSFETGRDRIRIVFSAAGSPRAMLTAGERAGAGGVAQS